MYAIRLANDVLNDMRRIPTFHRVKVLEAVETQLIHDPMTVSRNKKLLINLNPPWHAEPPIWELRVGSYRVFYDVEVNSRIVYVRAVRLKPHGFKTEEII